MVKKIIGYIVIKKSMKIILVYNCRSIKPKHIVVKNIPLISKFKSKGYSDAVFQHCSMKLNKTKGKLFKVIHLNDESSHFYYKFSPKIIVNEFYIYLY